MAAKTIHLIFKTHLDIGFSNLADEVRREYHDHFMPQALTTAEHFFGEEPANPRFIWTTGSWLIADYLASAPPKAAARLERAIERGLIRWHALPFTTHSELMSPALFRAGLSYSRDLDRRFGRTTTAAKMTDVPGHTRGIVPLLAEAGVHFLHLGVNEASPVPEVPAVFRWRADSGEEVVVMYHDSYGGTHFPDGQAEGLSFAHTNDNAGPQTISQTVEVYRQLQSQHPGAIIRASTLDAYGELLWAQRAQFPVVDVEIGDSWIHGVGSDPVKVSRFLALRRLYDALAADGPTPERLAFGRGLALVPEHTWGVDIKTFLRDEDAWDRPAFAAARSTDPRFAFTEESWAEQRRYLDGAVDALGADDRKLADAAWTDAVPDGGFGAPRAAAEPIEIAGWSVTIDPATGDVAGITSPAGLRLKGQDGRLAAYRYESYDAGDVERHLDSYLTHRPDWAILDHARPGLGKAHTARSAVWVPRAAEVRADGQRLSVLAEMPADALRDLGAPRAVMLMLEPEDERRLRLSIVLRDKAANRMPEASFLSLSPEGAGGWRYRKMGAWQDPQRTARRGGGQLQAVEEVSAVLAGSGGLRVMPLDTPLVGPQAWPFMVFNPAPPDLSAGVRFNLHNNKWATNFPMWWEGSFVARFVIEVGPSAG
jgi:hypothetical protein